MLLIAVVYAAFPQLRNWYLVAAATGVGLVLTFIGSGRVYRPAVTQVSDAIICRYNPWREGVRGHEKVPTGGQVEVPSFGQLKVPTLCSSC
jgi:hypothetical protein